MLQPGDLVEPAVLNGNPGMEIRITELSSYPGCRRVGEIVQFTGGSVGELLKQMVLSWGNSIGLFPTLPR